MAGAFIAAQAVPYGRAHDNPPEVRQAPWPSPAARQLAERACFDCHSHQTRWPWYAHVAPASWLVQYDVDEGRKKLNFSAWSPDLRGVDDAAEVVLEEEMPPLVYLPAHPRARLTAAERQQLADALQTMAGANAMAGANGGHKAGHKAGHPTGQDKGQDTGHDTGHDPEPAHQDDDPAPAAHR